MHQAEDRGHRAGQTAAGYHIITLLARLSGGYAINLDQEVGAVLIDKMAAINETLAENAAIAGQRIAGDDAAVRRRVIEALLSSEQKAAAAENTAKKLAAKRGAKAKPTE